MKRDAQGISKYPLFDLIHNICGNLPFFQRSAYYLVTIRIMIRIEMFCHRMKANRKKLRWLFLLKKKGTQIMPAKCPHNIREPPNPFNWFTIWVQRLRFSLYFPLICTPHFPNVFLTLCMLSNPYQPIITERAGPLTALLCLPPRHTVCRRSFKFCFQLKVCLFSEHSY